MKYTSVKGDNTYELTITKNNGRAAYTPKSGDTYVLTIKVTATGIMVTTSSGTVESAANGEITLKPANSEAEFTVTITSGTMTAITPPEGTSIIPGTTVAAPGAGMTAGSGGNQEPPEPTNPLANTTWSNKFPRTVFVSAQITEEMLIAAGFPEELVRTLTFTVGGH